MFVRLKFRYVLVGTILLLVAVFASGCPLIARAIPINIPDPIKVATETPPADVVLPD